MEKAGCLTAYAANAELAWPRTLIDISDEGSVRHTASVHAFTGLQIMHAEMLFILKVGI